jgi:GTP-binding protein YchF
MGFCCGIVGLPNVGKSTLFNALTATANAQAANYPFCTIEPNVGRVGVPDPRLFQLATLASSQKIIPTQLEFVDIAGLVKGASKGEGLGNQFLGHIRETDAIIHVLRCFEDSNITHVEGGVDPIRDLEIIETELLLSDLEAIEKRKQSLLKRAKSGDEEAKKLLPLIDLVLPVLEKGDPARIIGNTLKADDQKMFKALHLITSKPVVYVCNVLENELATGNAWVEKVRQYRPGAPIVIISADIESQVSLLENDDEKSEFLMSLGLAESGLNQVIRAGYNLLGLLTFFTIGPKEARAWTLKNGLKAPQAAGEIHTDFERGFICAETISFNDYIEFKGETGAKANGKMRQEGRDYLVHDGDIFHFRFNV